MKPTPAGYIVGSRTYRLNDVISLLRHAEMSASYKPALLAAIVRFATREQSSAHTIQLTSLADEYLKMYWSQVVVFRLRHSARDSAQPVIVRDILAAADRSQVRRLEDLPGAKRENLVKAIAKVLPVNVLTAFHATKPERMPALYEWQKKLGAIELSDEAIAFITENASALLLASNYYLARFLSKLNAVPHIVEKVERDVPPRASLQKYAARLCELGESSCFYCGTGLYGPGEAAIDHFIPWTFVYEDKLWNLVLACQPCNSAKSDGLPSEELLTRLVALNKMRESSPTTKIASQFNLQRAASELPRLYLLAHEEQWPMWRSNRKDAG